MICIISKILIVCLVAFIYLIESYVDFYISLMVYIIIMYLFVVFLFPVVLISFLVLNFEKKNILVACSSFIFSATFCLIVGLLENFYRLIPVNYFDNFIFHFTSEIILPVISLMVLFYFLSKDDLSYKVKSVFPLLVAFYSEKGHRS